MTPHNPNAATIAELRRVADILDANPDLPQLAVGGIALHVRASVVPDEATRRAIVDRLNVDLGVEDPCEVHTDTGTYSPTTYQRRAWALTPVELVPALGGAA